MPAEPAASNSHATSLEAALTRILGREAVATGESELALHARDEGFPRRGRQFTPDIVVYPRSTGDVAEVVSLAASTGTPLTPWGAGTSLEGNALATRGGIVLDTTKMDAIVAVHPDDLQVVVQAGVLRPTLNERLRDHGLFFPPDPGVPSTIGGMIGNNSSGTKSVKYGVTRDYVLALEVVLADGRVIRTGSRAAKTASGYNLTGLFVGAEGTLGVVTEVTLRLAPWPPVVSGALARFKSLDDAAAAVSALISSGVVPSMAELLDARIVALINESGFDWPEQATLMLEFTGGSDTVVEEELAVAQAVVEEYGARPLDRVAPDDHRRHTEARHAIGHTVYRSAGRRNIKSLDVTVPISRYADLVRAAYAAMDKAGLLGYVLGHAGDGNLHVLLPGDARDAEEWGRVEEAEAAIVRAALAFEGTTTGEHGIGLGRKEFLVLEHGAGVDVMRSIKSVLDPRGILNPDKIFDFDVVQPPARGRKPS